MPSPSSSHWKRPWARFLLWFLWTIVLLHLSLMPGTGFHKQSWIDIWQLDKFAHVFLYFIWAFLGLRFTQIQQNLHPISVLIIGFLLGVTMELCQLYFIVHRSFDLLDILANTAGLLLAYLVWKRILARLSAKE